MDFSFSNYFSDLGFSIGLRFACLLSRGHRESFPLSVFVPIIAPYTIVLRSARYVPSPVGLAKPVPAGIRLRHRGRDRDRESVGRPTGLRPPEHAD